MSNIVYILTNEAMVDLVKIGRTNKNVAQRIKELDSTAIPLPFQCFYAAKVNDAKLVEARLHKIFADKRIRSNREFFRADPNQVKEAIKLAEIEEITPKEDIIVDNSDVGAIEKYGIAEDRKGRLNFKELSIPTAAILTFIKDKTITCSVLSDNSNLVIFNEQSMSLSKAALAALHTMGYKWISARGSNFWEYEEKSLTARRLSLEQ